MSSLPPCPFLHAHTNEYSPAENVKCLGPFYGDQIERVCGSRGIGKVLEHFSHKTLPDIISDVERCCRNESAGQVKPNGYKVPAVNKRARQSLMSLLALGQQRPELFENHRVAIIVPMEQILRA